MNFTVKSRVYTIFESGLNSKMAANRDAIKSAAESSVTSLEDFSYEN